MHANAVSEWHSPIAIQGPGGFFTPIENGLYERYEYAGLGTLLGIITEDGKNPADGDTWSAVLATEGIESRIELTYSAASDCVLWRGSPITCGLYVPPDDPTTTWHQINVYWEGQCRPENPHTLTGTYPDRSTDSWAFSMSRFVPEIAQTFVPEHLEPKRTASGVGQAGDIAAYVTDDLFCGYTLEGVRVKLKATVVGGTNGQGYLADGDLGTGRFSSRGYNAVLNPGGSAENGTVIEGETNGNGLFIARYHAQDHGAEEKIAFEARRPATADEPELKGISTEASLLIAIPDLVRITYDHAPLAFYDGDNCPQHDPKPHWLTANTRTRVMALAAMYHYRTGRVLSLNDGSLPYGGVIANLRENKEPYRPQGRDALCHGSHRQGVDIDINSHDRQVGPPGQEPIGVNIRETSIEERGQSWTLLAYLDDRAERLDGTDHHRRTSIHYRFPD